jgi:hypothetical protein
VRIVFSDGLVLDSTAEGAVEGGLLVLVHTRVLARGSDVVQDADLGLLPTEPVDNLSLRPHPRQIRSVGNKAGPSRESKMPSKPKTTTEKIIAELRKDPDQPRKAIAEKCGCSYARVAEVVRAGGVDYTSARNTELKTRAAKARAAEAGAKKTARKAVAKKA